MFKRSERVLFLIVFGCCLSLETGCASDGSEMAATTTCNSVYNAILTQRGGDDPSLYNALAKIWNVSATKAQQLIDSTNYLITIQAGMKKKDADAIQKDLQDHDLAQVAVTHVVTCASEVPRTKPLPCTAGNYEVAVVLRYPAPLSSADKRINLIMSETKVTKDRAAQLVNAIPWMPLTIKEVISEDDATTTKKKFLELYGPSSVYVSLIAHCKLAKD